MAERNSATWHERQASALLCHKDGDDRLRGGTHLWDTSPATRGKFSTLSGPDVYTQHLTHMFAKQASLEASSRAERRGSPRLGSIGAYYAGGGDVSEGEEADGEAEAGVRRVLSMRLNSTNGRDTGAPTHRKTKRRGAPRCARDSSRTRAVTYDYTPGPGAYDTDFDRNGVKQTFGGSGVAWSSGKEGSQGTVGRGTAIQGPPRWSAFVGAVPADPAHHGITNDKGVQGPHIGYMSPGPKYLPPSELPTTKQGKFFVEKRMPDARRDAAPAVGSYSPVFDRNGDPIPFSNAQKLKEGRPSFTFSKSTRREREENKLGADSVGPAHYDYLQLSTIYDADPKQKKRHSVPRDGSVFPGSMEYTPYTPSFNARGETFVEMVQRQGRALPGPGDYDADQQPRTQWDKGHTFGTGKQSESAAEWNPTCSTHLTGKPNAAPQYVSSQHAKSLYGTFSPGPALYSPDETNSGRIKSDKTGPVMGTANRFAVSYVGGMPEPLSASTVRRDDAPMGGDSAFSLTHGVGMRGAPVGVNGNDASWRSLTSSQFDPSGPSPRASGHWRETRSQRGRGMKQGSSDKGSGQMVSMWMDEEEGEESEAPVVETSFEYGQGGETSDYQTDYAADNFEEEEEE